MDATRRDSWAVLLKVKLQRLNGGGWCASYYDVYGKPCYSPEEAMESFNQAMTQKGGSYLADVDRGIRKP